MPNGVTIQLAQSVFIPDRTTEEFIAEAIKVIKSLGDNRTVAEVGVGSGIVIATLAHMFPRQRFLGFDVNRQAIALTNQNIKANHVNNCEVLVNSSSEWIASSFNDQIDLIISNPPYVGRNEIQGKNFHKDYPDAGSQPPESLLAADSLGTAPYVDIIQEGYRRDVKHWVFRVNSNRRQDLVARVVQLFLDIRITVKTPAVLYLTRP